jgi:hypothetical protein
MISLGFKVDMDPHDSNFPTAKVAMMTSGTTALMPTTASWHKQAIQRHAVGSLHGSRCQCAPP